MSQLNRHLTRRDILAGLAGTVFAVLGIMQWFWYSSDRRRERFVGLCRDPDIQQLTFEHDGKTVFAAD